MKLKTIDSKYNFAVSRLFTSSLLSKLNDPLEEQSIRDLLYECKLYPKNKKWDLACALQVAYDYLKMNYRCEYIYKNEIANQLLLNYHYDNSAALLREVTSINSIADIVIINGHTVVYEIKSDLDSFDRLTSQINSYKPLYDFVYVVTHPAAVNTIKSKIDKSVGIIVLEQDGSLVTQKKPISNRKLFDPNKAVFTLRHSELLAAYNKYVGKPPAIGTALIHELCYNWFITLDKYGAHAVFNEALKSRKPSTTQFKLVKDSPFPLRMVFLSKTLSKKYCIETMEKFNIFD